MQVKRHFVIEARQWNTDVHVMIGVAPARWDALFKRYGADKGVRDHFRERMEKCTGAQIMYEHERMWNLFAYFPRCPRPNQAQDLGAVSHEMLHATIAILRRKGVTLCEESEEAFTYLTEFFVREFWWKLAGKGGASQ